MIKRQDMAKSRSGDGSMPMTDTDALLEMCSSMTII